MNEVVDMVKIWVGLGVRGERFISSSSSFTVCFKIGKPPTSPAQYSKSARHCPDANFARAGGAQHRRRRRWWSRRWSTRRPPGSPVRPASGGRRRRAKARRTLSARWVLVSRVCVRVGWTRRRRSASKRHAERPGAAGAARRSAWLNSRSRSFGGCNGTGTIKSHFSSRNAGSGARAGTGPRGTVQTRAARGVFVAMNGFQHHAAGGDGGARGTEMQFHVAAIGAFEGRGDVAAKGTPAALAEAAA